MNLLSFLLLFSALIFASGLALALSRHHALLVLGGIELMLNAANLNFILFWRFAHGNQDLSALVFVLFALATTAAEAVVGFALMRGVYRHYRTLNTSQIDLQKE